MTSVAVIAIALAVFGFCAMHVVAKVLDYRKARDAKNELAQIKKELEDETLRHGNVARIAQLRARMLELEDRVR